MTDEAGPPETTTDSLGQADEVSKGPASLRTKLAWIGHGRAGVRVPPPAAWLFWVIGLAGGIYSAIQAGYPWAILAWMSTHWFAFLFILAAILMASGRLDLGLGIGSLFHHQGSPRGGPGSALGAGFGITVLILETWTIVFMYEYVSSFEIARNFANIDLLLPNKLGALQDPRIVLLFLGRTASPFLIPLLLAGALPTLSEGMPPRTVGAALGDALRYLLGIALGIAAIAVGAIVAGFLLKLMQSTEFPAQIKNVLLISTQFFRNDGLNEIDGGSLAIRATLAVFLIFLAVATLVLCLFRNHLTPSLLISVHLCSYAATYFFLMSLQGFWRLPFVVCVILWILLTNHGIYKYRFPHMGSKPGGGPYYTSQGIVDLADDNKLPPHPSRIGPDPLGAWKEFARHSQRRECPKLVLVCMSGGAYRAGYWSAVVLDRLQELSAAGGPLQGLADSIRLLTGASGGMVGGAYFAATRPAPDDPDRFRGVVEAIDKDTNGDSLTPILQQLFCEDLPLIFWPSNYQKRDRGTVLDEQWKALHRGELSTFAGLKEGELNGWRPSLILSPMVVETGRRMLISNLDLDYLSDTISNGGAHYSRSAVQFFKEFAGAYDTFKVATGVRMSATFPFASPAVNLPTKPPRRLVDAGYYDNYGVNLAAAWAYHHRDFISDHTSGLALIQIQAYATQKPKLDKNAIQGSGAAASPLASSLQWLSSPLAGADSARNWTMSFRNDEQVRQLDDMFNGICPGMFNSFVFENEVPFGMNWFISRHDVAEMKLRITKGDNADELKRLSKWWNSVPDGAPCLRQNTGDQPSAIIAAANAAEVVDPARPIQGAEPLSD